MDIKTKRKIFKHYDKVEARAYRAATKAANTGKGFESAYAAYRAAAKKNKEVTDKYA